LFLAEKAAEESCRLDYIFRSRGILSQRLRSETSPDHAEVSFYLHCSLNVNKDKMTL